MVGVLEQNFCAFGGVAFKGALKRMQGSGFSSSASAGVLKNCSSHSKCGDEYDDAPYGDEYGDVPDDYQDSDPNNDDCF